MEQLHNSFDAPEAVGVVQGFIIQNIPYLGEERCGTGFCHFGGGKALTLKIGESQLTDGLGVYLFYSRIT